MKNQPMPAQPGFMRAMTDAEMARARAEARFGGVQETAQHAGAARGMALPLPTAFGAPTLPVDEPTEHAPIFGADPDEDAQEGQQEAQAAVQPEPVSEEAAEVEEEPEEPRRMARSQIPAPAADNRPPAWFPVRFVPRQMKFPRGQDVYFLRIRSELTSAKHKADRFVIAWELSDGDTKLAYGRSLGDPNRAAQELAKQMVRVIDGATVAWDGMLGEGNPDLFWQEIGAKGRDVIMRLYLQLHVLAAEEQADFFVNCVGRVRTG